MKKLIILSVLILALCSCEEQYKSWRIDITLKVELYDKKTNALYKSEEFYEKEFVHDMTETEVIEYSKKYNRVEWKETSTHKVKNIYSSTHKTIK